ncbi:MAG TPA: zinc ribbon domain-containing protein [Anaerolineales bacterium]
MARRTRGFVQLEWVCPNCATRNPGPKKSCINCGALQPEDVQFQRAADEQLVKDQEAIRAAQAGADYICPYCGTRNAALAKVCVQCGGDLVEARRRAAGAELQANTGPRELTCTNCGTVNPSSRSNCLKCGAPLPRGAAAATAVKAAVQAGGVPTKKGPKWWVWALVGGAVVVCASAIALFAVPAATVSATVSDVRWQTSVPVQEMRSVHYSNEAGSPPSGAYAVSCHTEDKEVCQERTIDKGNGYGEVVQDCHTESQQYCSYDVDEWKTIQTYTLDGHDASPVYAQPNVGAGQRLGDQSADYSVVFESEKGQKIYSPSTLTEYARFSVGSTWTLKLNAVGTILSVE